MNIGFSGTQRGMTVAQQEAVERLLGSFDDELTEFHHGDCVGADAEAHKLARHWADCEIHAHPPIENGKRAYCKADVVHPERAYLVRNRIIVDMTETLICAPGEDREVLRSGTWATYRYAKKKIGRSVYTVWPDGTVREENT
ncbi:MAG TPA: hypothetical protein VM531_09070 [Sphingomicrobium sp.]|jgi:hypothetical protein|nr:hypothetical protein [Sphingomicrobium sp.]